VSYGEYDSAKAMLELRDRLIAKRDFIWERRDMLDSDFARALGRKVAWSPTLKDAHRANALVDWIEQDKVNLAELPGRGMAHLTGRLVKKIAIQEEMLKNIQKNYKPRELERVFYEWWKRNDDMEKLVGEDKFVEEEDEEEDHFFDSLGNEYGEDDYFPSLTMDNFGPSPVEQPKGKKEQQVIEVFSSDEDDEVEIVKPKARSPPKTKPKTPPKVIELFSSDEDDDAVVVSQKRKTKSGGKLRATKSQPSGAGAKNLVKTLATMARTLPFPKNMTTADWDANRHHELTKFIAEDERLLRDWDVPVDKEVWNPEDESWETKRYTVGGWWMRDGSTKEGLMRGLERRKNELKEKMKKWKKKYGPGELEENWIKLALRWGPRSRTLSKSDWEKVEKWKKVEEAKEVTYVRSSGEEEEEESSSSEEDEEDGDDEGEKMRKKVATAKPKAPTPQKKKKKKRNNGSDADDESV